MLRHVYFAHLRLNRRLYRPVPTAATVHSDLPAFNTLDRYSPRPSAMCNGALISIAILLGVAFAATHGGSNAKLPLVGTHHTGPRLIGLDRASFTAGLSSQVTFGPRPEDPWREIASLYFNQIRVLRALDSDQDLTLSPWEIFTAATALRRLDTDHDGRLSPEECGFSVPADVAARFPAAEITRARLNFMRANPVLAALDSDHDGEISPAEILHSPASLKSLDRNGDGALTPSELIPDNVSKQTALILATLDINRDGKISLSESSADAASPLKSLLAAADRNHDGVVTMDELSSELRLREERARQLDSARSAAGLDREGFR